MDESVCVGESVLFAIKTVVGNECLAAVGYWDSEGSWVGPNLNSLVADDEGICQWTWQVPDDAQLGIAEFRVGVRGYGDMHSLIPEPFEIVNCDR